MVVDPDTPAARAEVPWWRSALTQYLAPAAFSTVVASLIAIFTAITTVQDRSRQFNQTFEKLATDPSITNAFQGEQSGVLEEKAAATLLALQAVAESEQQKRTVLIIGARLLDANSKTDATGGAAARVLDVLIASLDPNRDARLIALTRSSQFIDLVTAGYANDYYNDFGPRPYLWPTLNGDQPITSDAKEALLEQITPKPYEGWIDVATFPTTYHLSRTAGAPAPNAETMFEDMVDVNVHHDLERVSPSPTSEYAVDERGMTAPATPAPGSSPLAAGPTSAVANMAIDLTNTPASIVTVKARLLRDRAPVEYVSADGTFRRGSLGRIIGDVPVSAALKICEPLRPVLVFVDSSELASAGAKPVSGPPSWQGLVHVWAHVSSSANCTAGSGVGQ